MNPPPWIAPQPPLLMMLTMIAVWFLSSIPVYLAAKLVAGGRASIGKAMIATLVGPIVFSLSTAFIHLALEPLPGIPSAILALALAFIMWLATYKAVFDVGWLEAFTIAVLAILIFIILMVLLGSLAAAMILL